MADIHSAPRTYGNWRKPVTAGIGRLGTIGTAAVLALGVVAVLVQYAAGIVAAAIVVAIGGVLCSGWSCGTGTR